MRKAWTWLIILTALMLPAVLLAGAVSWRALAWLVLAGLVLVVLIDLNDRFWEWLHRRRWPGTRL
jgi:Ni/Fe-hydrogenase subunit HybB-like protein